MYKLDFHFTSWRQELSCQKLNVLILYIKFNTTKHMEWYTTKIAYRIELQMIDFVHTVTHFQ